jgi:hypothetical protein
VLLLPACCGLPVSLPVPALVGTPATSSSRAPAQFSCIYQRQMPKAARGFYQAHACNMVSVLLLQPCTPTPACSQSCISQSCISQPAYVTCHTFIMKMVLVSMH